jgi:hypothetical protein
VIRDYRRDRIAEREKVYRRVTLEAWGQRLLDNVAGAADPGCTIGVRDPHAPRHVDQHRDDDVARWRRWQQDDRTADKNRDHRECERSQSDQDSALKWSERDERPAVGKKGDANDADRYE